MKAIIIAAGKGSRLGSLTDNTPKCLLEVNGKTILQHQLDAYQENGITDISVIKGYCQDTMNDPQLKYYVNDNYENNNILNSLMYAEKEMDEAFVASYSDIIFESKVVNQLLQEEEDISIVIDADWKHYYEGRDEHPIEEAEKVIIRQDGSVLQIGKILHDHENNSVYEFIGMLKCTKQGAKIFKDNFHKAKKKFDGKPFMRARTFDHAYITDFVQYLTDAGIKVYCSVIHGGWQEIDIMKDLEKART